jgi:hypothetical protein
LVKLSLLILLVLTVLIAFGLRWREERMAAVKAVPKRRAGWLDQQKHKLNRWMTAATLATLVTMVVLGGLHWLRVLVG